MASPEGSTAGVPGACSQAHQSLLALPPSTWWAAVEDPNRKPSGNSGSGDAAGTFAVAEAGCRAQRDGLVRALPREVVVLAAEVAVGRGLLIDRAVQPEVVAEGAGPQVEVLAHELRDLRAADLLRAERLHHQRDGVRDADRIGDLHLAALREPGRDDVLGDVAGGIRGGAVDLARVLAREGAAAVAGHAPVGVDDDLAPGQA